MQYGYFDDKQREYVITDPKTPMPWANYLGSPAYGAIISNNAGGYSFRQSGANGRILRYYFNGTDTPGRYLYLKDLSTGDFRCLSRFPDLCRHGTGYSRMETAFSGLRAEMTYYVPDGECYEIWLARIINPSDQEKAFSLTGYAEFTENSNYEQDTVNQQYSRFITQTQFEGFGLRQMVHANLVNSPLPEDRQVEERHFLLNGAPVASYCGDRDVFLGNYGSYDQPTGLKTDTLGNVLNYGGCSCGALAADIRLSPGQSRTVAFVLAPCDEETAKKLAEKYADPESICEKEISALRRSWSVRFSALQVHTPDPDFDRMVNTWNAYNCFITFTWSRAASFMYCGLRNGYGYRDTVQDIQGVIHLSPEDAKKQLSFMLSAQASNGGGLPLVKYTHTPGQEDTPDDESYRSTTGHPAWRADDALWLFPTVYKYLTETGNIAYLDEMISYADHGEDTVYGHLKNALRFSAERLGAHGLPAGLYADWNDCLRLGAKGESTFVALQYYYAMRLMTLMAEKKQDAAYAEKMRKDAEAFGSIIEKDCFLQDRYIRGYTEDGRKIGAPGDAEAAFWLNPQSWSVISGAADQKRGEMVMDGVRKHLNTPYGAMLMVPPFRSRSFDGALAVIFNAGMKENASVFCQTQGWLILAEALLGRGDQAFAYYRENCPAAHNETADQRMLEPYVYGQFTESTLSPHAGRSHVHWLTGTASTMMVASVEGILGLRPTLDGLTLSPAVPSEWDGFEMDKVFRGKKMHITVQNPGHVPSGCKKLTLNGEDMQGAFIPAEKLRESNEIVLIMS